MRLSSKAIKEFQQIYYNFYRVSLTEEETNSKGLELLEFIHLLSKPIPLSDKDKLKNL